MKLDNFILCVIENTIITNLIGVHLKKKSKYFEYIFIILFSALSYLIDTYTHNWFLFIAQSVLILYALLNYYDNVKTKCFTALKIFIINLLYNIIIVSLISILIIDFAHLRLNNFFHFIIILLAKISFYYGYLYYDKRVNRSNRPYTSPYLNILLYIVLFISMILLYNSFIKNRISDTDYIIFVILLIGSIFFISYSYTVRNFYFITNRMQEFQNSFDSILKKSVEELDYLKHFQHDHAKHIRTLYFMINENEFDKAKKYINELNNETKAIQFNLTGNIMLDFIINYYINFSKDLNITFYYHIFENLKFISDYDLSILMYNLLDNAFEAQEKITKYRCVILDITNNGKTVILKITNTKDTNMSLNTNKKDKLLHGNGLSKIDNILEKYNCFSFIENNLDYFTYTIIFDIEK